MMFEETLAYWSRDKLAESFSPLPAAVGDADTRRFYVRMACDVAIVAAGTKQPSHGRCIASILLAALAATPAESVASWQRFHREVAILAVRARAESAPEQLREAFPGALGRLRQFITENQDLADQRALDEFERPQRGLAFGA